MKRKRVTAPSRVTRRKTVSVIRPFATKVTKRVGLGNKKYVKMIYADRGLSVNPGIGGIPAYYQFRLNSIFDPDFTGIGHQPMAHDQMAVLFEEYVVTGVSYKIQFINVSDTNSYLTGVYFSDRSDTPANVTDVLEQGQVQWSLQNKNNAGSSVKEYSGYINLPMLMGKQRQNYINSPDVVAAFGSSPTDTAYVTLFAASAGSSDPEAIFFTVELCYDVLCMGSRLATAS